MCAGMRWERSMIVFALTLSIGLSLGMRLSIKDWLWPSFTKAEALEKLTHQLHYHRTDAFTMMKCLRDESCLVVADGEVGTVIGIEPVPETCGYFLKVRWNRHTDHYISYIGRYTYRESLTER